jgi:hypothetical protein
LSFDKEVKQQQSASLAAVQPRMAILGDVQKQKCAIQIAGKTFYTDGIIDTFISTFKVFCGLNCHYGNEAAIPWTFVQQGVFNIFTGFDHVHPTLKNLQKHITVVTVEQISLFDATFDPKTYLLKTEK